MAMIRAEKFLIRHYQSGEEHKLVALMNAVDGTTLNDIVTVDMIRDEWHNSRLVLERDTWVALNEAGDYIATAEVWFDDPDNDQSVITRHIGFNMHPDYREEFHDLMEELLEKALRHASSHPFSHNNKGYILRAWASAHDKWREQVILSHGFKLVHIGYTMIHEQLDSLPPVPSIAGIQIEGWSPARDFELWQALNEGFSDVETFTSLSWSTWQKLYHLQRDDQELWCLAIDEQTNNVVGLAITEIDRKANQNTARQDGWVVDLAVVPGARGKGIGEAVLLAAMHKIRDYGMTAVKMGIDSYNPVKGISLYEKLGFQILQGNKTYHRWLVGQRLHAVTG